MPPTFEQGWERISERLSESGGWAKMEAAYKHRTKSKLVNEAKCSLNYS